MESDESVISDKFDDDTPLDEIPTNRVEVKSEIVEEIESQTPTQITKTPFFGRDQTFVQHLTP